MSEPNSTQGWRFRDRAGTVVIDGEAHWPATIRIELDSGSVFDLAMELLRAYRESSGGEVIKIFRVGVMEREPGDDYAWEE